MTELQRSELSKRKLKANDREKRYLKQLGAEIHSVAVRSQIFCIEYNCSWSKESTGIRKYKRYFPDKKLFIFYFLYFTFYSHFYTQNYFSSSPINYPKFFIRDVSLTKKMISWNHVLLIGWVVSNQNETFRKRGDIFISIAEF